MKQSGIAALLLVTALSAVGVAQAAPPAAPSPDDMIKALAAPVGGQGGATRNFHRVQRSPTADTGNGPSRASAGGGGGNAADTADGQPARREIGVPLLFDLASAKLRPESYATLANIAKALQSPALKSAKILLEGHTDASGGAERNLALSEERANAVKDYLVTNGGIDAARLSTVGKGQTQPANPANPLAAENRRVVLVNISEN